MSKTVADRSPAVNAMLDAAEKGRALMGGTRQMQAEGTKYLPKNEAESEPAYKNRKALSWLFNGYKETVKDVTGRVFDVPVEIKDAPPDLDEWSKNIDLQGNDLSRFCRKVFKDAVAGSGIGYIMVDAPQAAGDETIAQVKAENLRPYLIHLRLEDVLGWQTAIVNNVTVLDQIRIFETVSFKDPDDEFKSTELDQVRVIDRVAAGENALGHTRTRLFRHPDGSKDDWIQWGEDIVGELPEITIIPFYAERTGFFTGEPLLADLADVNVAHWQSQSDQRNIMHAIRTPMLFGAGLKSDEDIVVSSAIATVTEDTNADLKWVEHTGKAAETGVNDLVRLERQMEVHGLKMLAPRPGAQSATGEAIDALKETSTLSMTADELKDAMEVAVGWMGDFAGQDFSGAQVDINKDFGVDVMDAQELLAMLSAVNTGNMSRETFIEECARRGVIRAEIKAKDEIDRIEAEGGGLMDDEDTLGGGG